MKVKNLKGASELSCGCGTGLRHWERSTNTKAASCAVYGCHSKAEVGAHVTKSPSTKDADHYLVPMCRAHNQSTSELAILESVKLVPADKQKSCG